MKIREVRVGVFRVGLEIPDFGSANDMVVVKVIGEDGSEGIGYVTDYHHIKEGVYFSDLLAEFIRRIIARFVVGRDTTEYEAIWDELFQRLTRWGRRGFVIHAISGVDIAIWDLLAKEANKPLWRLLGGYRSEVTTYANTAHQLPPKELAAKALEYVKQGFDAVKIRGSLTAVSPEEATERIKAVREAVGPDVKLMVDLNGTYDLNLAMRMCRGWEKYELFWIEEPVHPDNLEGYKRLKRVCGIPIAAGEQHHTIYDFKLLLESEAVDIVQPDVGHVGGITEWLRVWALARAYGIPVSPHLMPIVSAHLVAAKPGTMWIEYTAPDNPLRSAIFDVFDEPKSIMYAKNGKVYVPETPGIGIKLKPQHQF